MQAGPQISINVGQVLEWLKFAGYLTGVVTVTWKLSKFVNVTTAELTSFAADIRSFIHESREHMKKMGDLADVVVGNHLNHIEKSLEKIEKRFPGE